MGIRVDDETSDESSGFEWWATHRDERQLSEVRPHRESGGGSLLAMASCQRRRSNIAELQSAGAKVQVNTKSKRIAEEVSHIRRGTTLQAAIEAGALSQWKADSECVADVLHIGVLGKPMYVFGAT